MKAYGYSTGNLATLLELQEVTLAPDSVSELRVVADFLLEVAKQIEAQALESDHVHLEDRHPEAALGLRFVVSAAALEDGLRP
ncbi:MAG: hypothetical protein AAF184_24740 [Pseudomonadota bacterium]